MFRGYRSAIATLAGLAIVAISLFFLISDLSTVDSAYRHSAADASIKYKGDADAYVKERCVTSAGLREDDCAPKADEAAREGQRKEQDLAAQNITAWWTKVMGVAALIGMALSAVGVWLVKTTFDETRKANEIAAKFQRAVIVPKLNIVDSSERTYVCSVEAENVGASPAVDVYVSAIVSQQIPQHPDNNSDFGGRWVVKPGESQFLAAFHSDDGSEDGKFVFGSIRYKTLLGSTHYTHFCFQIMRSRIHPYISAPASRIGVESVPSNWPDNT